jgi:amino acid transporter
MTKILLAILGFLVILLLLTEECRDALKKFWSRHTRTRLEKFFAYPRALVLALAAAGLILFSLWTFLAIPFSYD